MRPNKYLVAIRTIEMSTEEEIKYAGEDIEGYVDDLYQERQYLCSRIATLTKQRDTDREEIRQLKAQEEADDE